MTTSFRAIYEEGVLRPLTPLDLPESVIVECTPVTETNLEPPSGGEKIDEAKLASAQYAAREVMLKKIDQIPQTPVGDGLHGRDHDQILYGKPS